MPALPTAQDIIELEKLLQIFIDYWWAFLLLVIWSLVWKGLALWRSAQNGSKPWFIVFLLVNTVGILEIIYLFGFSKKPSWLKKIFRR